MHSQLAFIFERKLRYTVEAVDLNTLVYSKLEKLIFYEHMKPGLFLEKIYNLAMPVK